MSIFKIYEQVSTTWEKLRADMISHILLGVLLFGFLDLRLPEFEQPDEFIELWQNNPYYRMLQDLDLTLTGPILLALGIFGYAAVLRSVGGSCAQAVMFVWPAVPKPLSAAVPINRGALARIAETLDKEDFEDDDLVERLNELYSKYAMQHPEEMKRAFAGFDETASDRITYLRNACFFLLAWPVLFAVQPENSEFRSLNDHLFWTVFLLLAALCLVSKWRVNAYYRFVPVVQTNFVAARIEQDSQFAERQAETSERRAALMARIDQLVEERRAELRPPSLWGFVKARLVEPRMAKWSRGRKSFSRSLRNLWSNLETTASQFTTEPERKEGFERDDWLQGYFAYLVTSFCQRIRAIWRLLHVVCRGGP